MVAICGLRESLMTKAMPAPFATDPPAKRGKERTEYTGGARSAILNDCGYVGPPPGSADGSYIEEADKERVFG